MAGLQFINWEDPLNQWRLDTVAMLVQEVQKYAASKGLNNVILHSVEDNRWSDPQNGRFDIEIRFPDEKKHMIQQKLLYLKGEIIDGETFHKRREEFYPERKTT